MIGVLGRIGRWALGQIGAALRVSVLVVDTVFWLVIAPLKGKGLRWRSAVERKEDPYPEKADGGEKGQHQLVHHDTAGVTRDTDLPFSFHHFLRASTCSSSERLTSTIFSSMPVKRRAIH